MEDRILKQLTVMINNPQLMICGSQITSFDDVGKERVGSNHPSLTWEEYKAKPNHWFVNHPTVCYRKQAVIDAGNYNPKLSRMSEDFELELRMLKKYKLIYNLPESLLKYRLHPGQVTHNGGEEGRSYWMEKRMEIINGLVEEELEDEESVIELVDEELKEN